MDRRKGLLNKLWNRSGFNCLKSKKAGKLECLVKKTEGVSFLCSSAPLSSDLSHVAKLSVR